MIKIALVGCGRISKKHIEVLSDIDEFKIVAVCDINKNRASQTAKKLKVNYYLDIDKMLKEQEDIDLVSILTPSGLHYEHSLKIANYKKHIIVEKPMALRFEQAKHMIEVCRKNGVKLFVVKQNRYNLPVVKLKEAIDKNRFGKIFLGTIRVRWCRTQDYYNQDSWRGSWRFDGGVISNQAIHHIDLLQWLVGDVESVFAKGIKALANIEAEDTAVAIIKFKNGALGTIEATTATRPKDLEGSVSILGEKGSVEIGGFAVNEILKWEFSKKLDEDNNIIKNYSQNPPNIYGFGHKEFYLDILNSIKNNTTALVEGEEALKSIKLLNALYASIESGKEIYLDDFEPRNIKLGL